MEAELRERLALSLRKHRVPGGVVAVWHDGHLTQAAAGVLNVETSVETTPDALFPVGSITKPYTATLVMQLVGSGALDLDRPVCDVLPEFRLADPRATATITPRQLLCHTSGIDGDLLEDVSRNADAIERLMPQLSGLGQLHPPGAMFSYCNVGYVVLGRIIEVLTGQVWDDALAERILRPIGAAHSVTTPENALRHRTAFGHWRNPKSGVVELADSCFVPRSNGPAGTRLATSAADLIRFGRLHVNDGRSPDGTQILPAELARLMRVCKVKTPLSSRRTGWGLGWMCFEWDGLRLFGHDGGTNGTSAFLRILPEQDTLIALTANNGRSSGVFDDIVGGLLQDLAGVRLPRFSEPATPALLDLAGYAARYARNGQYVELRVDGKELSAAWGGKYVGEEINFKLTPLCRERFAARLSGVSQPLSVYFLDFDAGGRPRYLHFTDRVFMRDALPDAARQSPS
jgi:CubicO group peptidase (beta-lactamase class C family)